MWFKIVGSASGDSDTLELAFCDPVPARLATPLKASLEACGFSVKERRPDGKIVIWECVLPVGEILDSNKVDQTTRAVAEVCGIPL